MTRSDGDAAAVIASHRAPRTAPGTLQSDREYDPRTGLNSSQQSIQSTASASSDGLLHSGDFPKPVFQFPNPLMKVPHLRADLKFDAVIMLDPTISLDQQVFDLFDIRRRQHAPRLDLRRQ